MNEYKPDFRPMDGVSEILLQTYKTMIADGTIEKIARDQIEKMIQETLRDAMSWNGPAKAAFKERVEPLLIDAIESSDFGRMTEKLTGVINQALQASALDSYSAICDGVKAICGAPRFKRGQELKLSDIFAAYKHSCKDVFSDSYYFDKDELERDENGELTVYVYCNIDVSQEKRYFGDGDYTITFTPECAELDECGKDAIIDNSFSAKVHEYQSYGDAGKKRLMWFGSLDALTLRNLPEFALYLQAAKDAACNIIIDMDSTQDDIEITLEE